MYFKKADNKQPDKPKLRRINFSYCLSWTNDESRRGNEKTDMAHHACELEIPTSIPVDEENRISRSANIKADHQAHPIAQSENQAR